MAVNDKQFCVTLSMYFNVQWFEPRFQTNNTNFDGVWTPIDLQFMENLWVPNIFFYDLRSFTALNVPTQKIGWCLDYRRKPSVF